MEIKTAVSNCLCDLIMSISSHRSAHFHKHKYFSGHAITCKLHSYFVCLNFFPKLQTRFSIETEPDLSIVPFIGKFMRPLIEENVLLHTPEPSLIDKKVYFQPTNSLQPLFFSMWDVRRQPRLTVYEITYFYWCSELLLWTLTHEDVMPRISLK